MNQKLSVLTKQACRDLAHKKVHWLMFGILLIVFWIPLVIQIQMLSVFSSGQPVPPSRLGHTVSALFHVAVFFGMALSSVFASKSVDTEITLRTISAVMVRPIQRWEFLMGKVLGSLFFFLAFLLLAMASLGLAKVFCSFEFQEFFFPAIVQHICMGFTMIALGVALGAVLSPNVIVGLFVFGWMFYSMGVHIPADLHWVINAFKGIMHYALPAGIQVDLLSIDTTDLPFEEFQMRVAEMLENVMYGIFAFVLAAYGFGRRDLKLKESV